MMNWQSLLSTRRLGADLGVAEDPGRSEFHRDQDRIVFSSAFRRLGRKTQVHPLVENDHVHTRLTHSLEVASVGRSLGMTVGQVMSAQGRLPVQIRSADIAAIVQAACLAHDIGNPPFGHAGEYAIRDWFDRPEQAYLLEPLSVAERLDLLTFEGNAQGFRVMTQLENHRFAGGLRLTFATLGATLKYPWTSDYAGNKGKFSCYQAELHLLNQVADELGLLAVSPHRYLRHPLCYLMEAADDICYAILDLEDGIEMSLLVYEQVEPLLVGLCGGESAELRAEIRATASVRRRISLLRGKAIALMVQEVARAFLKHEPQMCSGEFDGDLLARCPDYVRDGIEAAKNLARTQIFRNRRKVEVEVGSYSTLEILLQTFCQAVFQLKEQGAMSFRTQRIFDLMEYDLPQQDWTLYQAYLRVMDFIGGMTDNYASRLARQLGGMV